MRRRTLRQPALFSQTEAKTCSTRGCLRKPLDNEWGLCGPCSGERPDGYDWCKACRQWRPEAELYRRTSGPEMGRVIHCKDCNRRMARERTYRTVYGITVEDYDRLYAEQDGRCAICNHHFDILSVDHDHKTGRVRGLLCSRDNLAIGNFRDDPDHLRRAIEYLQRD